MALAVRKSDVDYNRIIPVFNELAWGAVEPSEDVYNAARDKLNTLIARDFPELTEDSLWELRTEILADKERVKIILGNN